MTAASSQHGFPIGSVGTEELRRRLGPMIDAAVGAVAERGVRLVLHGDMAGLRDRHRADPALAADRPLPSQLDVDYCDLPPARAFWIEGLDGSGRLALTHAARRFDWTNTDLEAEGRASRIFYDRPERDGRPGEDLTLERPMPVRVAGRVAYVGGLWIRSDLRGRGLGRIMPRVGRAWSYLRWRPEFLFSHVVDRLLDAGMQEVYGYPHRHAGLQFRNRYGGRFAVSWVWMSGQEMLADSDRFLASFQSARPRR
ncbi:hypothetical protein STAQ_12730 [Allostella sp. ATCC 35155]|nr:hypothetical protein STAQ_12730 [Stella sp. ATCC 35155]